MELIGGADKLMSPRKNFDVVVMTLMKSDLYTKQYWEGELVISGGGLVYCLLII